MKERGRFPRSPSHNMVSPTDVDDRWPLLAVRLYDWRDVVNRTLLCGGGW